MVMSSKQLKWGYECGHCHSRYDTPPINMDHKPPYCPQCYQNFGIVTTLFKYAVDPDDPNFGVTTTGSTSYPRAHVITSNGGASIDTSQSKFGGASGKFVAANSQYLTTPSSTDWNFGSGAFTIDFWIRFNSLPSVGGYVGLYDQIVTEHVNQVQIYLQNPSGTVQIVFGVWSGGSTLTNTAVATSPNLTTGVWYHFALVCDGSKLYWFQGGTQLTNFASVTIPNLSATLYLASTAGTKEFLDGWLDEFRVSKGVARWTSNFTPPSARYDWDSYTKLLLHMDGTNGSTTFIDDVITGQTIGTRIQYTDVTGSAVSSFSFYVTNYTSGDKFVLSLYDDSSGNPNHRLWYSSTSGTDPGATGWATVQESSGTVDNSWNGTLTNNAYYWFMWQWNNTDSGPSYASGGANTGIYLAQAFGTLLSTWSGGTLSTENWSMYLTYTVADFSISLSSGTLSVNEGGGTNTLTVTCTTTSGAGQSVTLSGSGYPAGVTEGYSVNPGTTTFSSTLTVTATGSLTASTSTITITGTGTYVTHTATFTLTVNQQFTISASPSSVNNVTTPITSTVTVTVGSSAANVTLTNTNPPTGVTTSLNPSSGTPTFTSTITIALANVGAGSYNVVVSGTNGTVTHTVTITLTVLSQISVEAWIYPTSVTGLQTVICKGRPNAAQTNTNYGIRLNGTALQFYYTNNGSVLMDNIYTCGMSQPTLTSGLTNGNGYTSLAVTALVNPIVNGQVLLLISGTNTQAVTTSAAAAVGATSISVNSFNANYSYPTGTIVNSSIITTNNWYYVLVTYTWTQPSLIQVWVGSNLANIQYPDPSRLTLQVGTWTTGAGTSAPATNTYPLTLGQVIVDGTAAEKYTGYMANLKIYPRIIGNAEALKHYKGSYPTGYTVLELAMNEGSGTTITDSSGYGDNGTSSNLTYYTYNNVPNSQSTYGIVTRYFDRSYAGLTEAQNYGYAVLRIYKQPQRFVQSFIPLDLRFVSGQYVNIVDKSFRGRALLKEVTHMFDDSPHTELTVLYL